MTKITLRYKQEGCRFNSRRGHFPFLFT